MSSMLGLLYWPMTIEFRYVEADYVSAHLGYIRRHPWRFFLLLRVPIIMILSTAIVLVEYPDSWKNVGRVLLIGLGLIAFVLLVYYWKWHRLFKRTPFWHQLVGANIDTESVRIRVQGREATTKWDAFSDIYESGRVFVFVTSNSKFILLPKSGLSQNQIEELRNLLASNANTKVRMTA